MDNNTRGAIARLKSAITDQEVGLDMTSLLKKNDPFFDLFEAIMTRNEKPSEAKITELLKSFSELEESILKHNKEIHFGDLLRSISVLITEILIKKTEWYPKG